MNSMSDSRLLRSDAYIDGGWVTSSAGKTFEVTDPADGTVLTSVADLDISQVREAIEAANSAWPSWRSKTAKERATLLIRWYDLMLENQEDLALLMTLEQGKPLAEARGEVAYAAAFLQWFAEEGKRIYGDVIPAHAPDKRIITFKQPIGVVAAITPWNFPSAMITRKVGRPYEAAYFVSVLYKSFGNVGADPTSDSGHKDLQISTPWGCFQLRLKGSSWEERNRTPVAGGYTRSASGWSVVV